MKTAKIERELEALQARRQKLVKSLEDADSKFNAAVDATVEGGKATGLPGLRTKRDNLHDQLTGVVRRIEKLKGDLEAASADAEKAELKAKLNELENGLKTKQYRRLVLLDAAKFEASNGPLRIADLLDESRALSGEISRVKAEVSRIQGRLEIEPAEDESPPPDVSIEDVRAALNGYGVDPDKYRNGLDVQKCRNHYLPLRSNC